MEKYTFKIVLKNNPQFACLIHYEGTLMYSPEVAIKEHFPTASKIIEFAHKNNIPIVEDYTLSRNVYINCEEGENVPKVCFKSLADIFGRYYKKKGIEVIYGKK